MSQAVSNVLYDAYRAKGYIEAVPRLYNELRFTYRPVQAVERAKLIGKMQQLGDKGTEMTMALVASKLTEWDLKDDTGKSYPVGKESILLLLPQLWVKLSNIVLGFDPSDVDPQWSANEKDQFDAEAFEVELTGRLPAAVREEQSVKNS